MGCLGLTAVSLNMKSLDVEAYFFRCVKGCSMNWFSPITPVSFSSFKRVKCLRQWPRSPMSRYSSSTERVRRVKATKFSNGFSQSHLGATKPSHCRLWRYADACNMMLLFLSWRWVRPCVQRTCKWQIQVILAMMQFAVLSSLCLTTIQ